LERTPNERNERIGSMPKMKTHKGAKKRFKVSKRGKVLHGKPGRRHLLSVKTSNRKRRLRKTAECSSYDSWKVKRLLGLA
jgi:large subunit ribosomal protein L35